jgi:hypothetical protein
MRVVVGVLGLVNGQANSQSGWFIAYVICKTDRKIESSIIHGYEAMYCLASYD